MKHAGSSETRTVRDQPSAVPRLHLLLCLGVDFDLAYIPHLCRHYAHAVDSWNAVLHSNDPSDRGDRAIARAKQAFESSLIEVASHAPLATREWRGEFGPYAKVDHMNALVREHVPPGDWIVYVDADELLDAPHKLGRLAAESQELGLGVVYGEMVDRFAPDRRPITIAPGDDLFVKFPLSEEYTKTQTRSWIHKPCLMRYDGEPPLVNCHDATGISWRAYRGSGRPVPTIWHFKWVATSREKLRYRVGSYKRQGFGWWPELVKSLKDIYHDTSTGHDAPSVDDPRPHPYADLEARAFWKTGWDAGAAVWRPKWRLEPEDRVVTFGSCFARHLGPALRKHGFTWLETEPPPHGLSRESASRFGYGHFTCRTGTLATPTALRQWLAWALGDETAPADPWVAGERFFDPFRPTIEPDGFVSRAEMLASRQQALRSLRRAIREADVFLFTLGMTESWVHDPEGWVYPACPGTAAGRFDATRHRLVNLSFAQARAALVAALERLWAARPGLRMLLTVSPVPLTATASGHHVVTATTESKAILRAVAGEVAASRPVVDYFPSYELVTVPGFGASRAEAPAAGETLFEANRRTVSRRGVARVMREFFVAHGAAAKPDGPSSRADSTGDDEPLDDHLEDPHCDDAWAEAFG